MDESWISPIKRGYESIAILQQQRCKQRASLFAIVALKFAQNRHKIARNLAPHFNLGLHDAQNQPKRA
jgi:hypothetical protein